MKRVKIDRPTVEEHDLDVGCCGHSLPPPAVAPFSLKTQQQLSRITLGHTPSARKSHPDIGQEMRHSSGVVQLSEWKQAETVQPPSSRNKDSSTPPYPSDEQI